MNNRIAVIGPTQSGKTCLAVGLSSTNTSGFVIQSVGEDGRVYLVDLKIALRPTKDEQGNLRPGKWPEASNLGTSKALCFDFLKEGKEPIRVEIPEYSGEMLRPEKFARFANEYLRDLDGVVLLVNPGAEAFQSGDQQMFEDYVAQYENVLTFLRDPNNGSHKAFIALSVTAADRINGDLSGKLDLFNECVQRLSNTLDNSCFKKLWQSFDVTITGHLKDQNKPTLAKGRRNSVSEPFLWLLDELNWRPKRQELFKKIRYYSFAVAGVVTLCGIGYGVHAWNVWESIDTERRALEQVIGTARNKDDLKDLRDKLDALQARTGLFADKARSIASEMEPRVWNAFETRINAEENVVSSDPEKNGDDYNCNRVDTLFTMWTPLTTECKKKHSEKKAQWEKAKSGFQDRFAVANMLKDVRKPLEESIAAHGNKAFELFYGLYAQLAAMKPVNPKSRELKEDLLSDLDARVEKEWREFAIPKFEALAQSNATHDATHAFVTLLDEWPVSTNGASAKMELVTSVSNSIPKWRTKYEVTRFSGMKSEALKKRALEDLAKLYPARVVTNEYLTLEYVTKQWENDLKDAYNEAYAKYITNFVNAVADRRGCPKLDDADDEKITRKADAVGTPFDKTKARDVIRAAVENRATEWRTQRRNECEGWINREVRPDREGVKLVREYIREKNKHRDHEDIFNETIRSAVYRYCERCFEEDIAYFQRKYDDKSECEKRFNDFFKPLCKILAEDTKDPNDVSWAIRFAKACVDTGNVNDNASFGEAFKEEFEITSINGKIDYNGANPLKGFLGTKFGVDVFRESNRAKPTTILERDESPVVKNDKEWSELSNGEGWKVYTRFADPLCLGMNVHDDRDVEIDYRRDYNDKDVEGFLRPFNSFYADTSDKISIELGGPFGKQTEDRKLAAYVQVNMKRISGGGICVLLSRAKESQGAER